MKDLTQFYSDETNRFYQLFPTSTIPTIKISGVPMHRFAKMDPLTDTLRKIKAAKPKGIVLDTCTGLGYTAIYSAKEKEVEKVYTHERDSNVLKMCGLNEASNELFTNDKIVSKNCDISIEIKKITANFFDSIIHDPPTPTMAVDLYTEKFYRELYRVLKNDGLLWHYMPNPGKLSNKDQAFKESIKRKLQKAGFKKISYDEESLGFLVQK